MRTQSKNNVSATVLRTDGKLYCTPEEVCEAFARHFNSSFQQGLNLVETFDCLVCERASENEVSLAVCKLKSRISSGHDGIPNFIIRGYVAILVPALTQVYN